MHISIFWFLFTAFCCFAGGVVASARYYGKVILELHKVITTLSNARIEALKSAQQIKKAL